MDDVTCFTLACLGLLAITALVRFGPELAQSAGARILALAFEAIARFPEDIDP